MSCTMPGGQCSRPVTKEYWGGTEKICDPEGCPGDCTHDTHWCYKEYDCIQSAGVSYWSVCSMFHVDSRTEQVVNKGFYSCEDVPVPINCYGCEREQDPEIYYVEYDSCNYN
jgi:hypothetical protein